MGNQDNYIINAAYNLINIIQKGLTQGCKVIIVETKKELTTVKDIIDAIEQKKEIKIFENENELKKFISNNGN